MTDRGNINIGGPVIKVTWTVDGVEHDRVDCFYTDPDTGAAAVQCSFDCCCRRKK